MKNKDKAIFAAQKAFANAGYQWVEHIFNDGDPGNCLIKMTKSTDPYDIDRGKYTVCWGLFTRAGAWSKALEWLSHQQSRSVDG